VTELTPIPFLTPHFPDPSLVARDYAEIVASGIFTNSGPFEQRFGAELARRIGRGVAVSVTSSATAGIQLACRVLFHPDRRYVLVASFTAVAGPLAVRWSGYEPVLIDVEPGSWQPDPAAAEEFLGRGAGDVAGILLTNTFGTANASIERWEALARRYDVALVVDSAAGFESRYDWDEPLGARGDCEVFSFHATKTVAIGEGGAVAARDHAVIEQIDRLKNFGFDDARRSLGVGLNAKLPELSSAIGLRQLELLGERLASRRERLHWYVKALAPLGCAVQPNVQLSAPPFFSAALPSADHRDALGCALGEAGIGWRTYYNPPVHRQPSFADAPTVGDLPVTDMTSRRIISLPLDERLSDTDIARIVDVVARVVDG